MQEFNENELKNIENSLSNERLGRYGPDIKQALRVYAWEIRLVESLHPLLHVLEVSLRNKLYNAVANLLNDQNWIMSKNNQIFDKLHPSQLKNLDYSIGKLQRKSNLTTGHVISEMNFGLWTELLHGRFEYGNFLWPRITKDVFLYLPKGISMSYVRKVFSKIRELRNRVYHHEPMFYLSDLAKQHDDMIMAIKWLDKSLMKLIEEDRFKKIYKEGLEIRNIGK